MTKMMKTMNFQMRMEIKTLRQAKIKEKMGKRDGSQEEELLQIQD
jgi:hypothetical protein